MNISLPLEPIDCSFYDLSSDLNSINSIDTTNDTVACSTKKQKQALHCRHAIDELLQTERDYTAHLTHLVTVCFDQVLWRQKWMLEPHKKTIVRNATELLQFHQALLAALEKACLDKNLLKRCGDIATVFLDMGSSFTLYDAYCDKHDMAISQCNDYRSKPEWLTFIKDCTSTGYGPGSSPLEQATKPLQFEDYLIKPVQRICRYQLLLKEILHYTPRNTTEFRTLDCALGMMQTVVAGIDRRKYHRDTTERTRLFIDRLDFSLSEGRLDKDSLHLLGNLVMAGAIDVIYSSLGQTNVASSSRSKYLGCFIFPTYLIMVRPKKVTNYSPKHWFPLRLVELEDLNDINDQREHAFVVRCKKYCFAFTATCQREKKLWMTKLSQAIADAKSQPRSADNFIVSSLHGIVKPTKIRTSRSVTNLLDFGRDSTSDGLEDGKMPMVERSVKRSKSHSFQLASYGDTLDPTNHLNPPPLIQRPTTTTQALCKRHSTDLASMTRKREQLKSRIRSEMYTRPPQELGIKLQRQRPGSMDVISTSSSQLSLNMIGKIKTNHQHALRMGTDHKLRDVCTQDYLSSRSWSTLLRESSNGHSDNSSNSNSPISTDQNRRKSSLSNLRPSTSSFSLLMQTSRRTSDNQPSNNINATDCTTPTDKSTNVYGKQPVASSPTPKENNRMSGIPRYTLRATNPPASCYGSLDFQQYYSGKCVNNGRPQSTMLPSLTHDPPDQKKKTTLRTSLSTYSLRPLKSNVKHVFVDGFRRLSPGQPKQSDSIFGRGVKTTASTTQAPSSQGNNTRTKRSSRLFSWVKHDDQRHQYPVSSLSFSITTQNNDSSFSSVSSTSTAATSTTTIHPQTSITTLMYDKHNMPNWSRKWIPSRK